MSFEILTAVNKVMALLCFMPCGLKVGIIETVLKKNWVFSWQKAHRKHTKTCLQCCL